jgi:hypothetical protein
MAEKTASPDYPIHEPLAERWSPYAFEDRLVPEADLRWHCQLNRILLYRRSTTWHTRPMDAAPRVRSVLSSYR